MPRTKKETSDATLAPKKRGRPAGSRNKVKVAPVKRGRPVGSTNKPKEVAPHHRKTVNPGTPITRVEPLVSPVDPRTLTDNPIPIDGGTV